ncbi:MAG: hypothetical protein WCT05_00810 [Lentisphaeria bacterium]
MGCRNHLLRDGFCSIRDGLFCFCFFIFLQVQGVAGTLRIHVGPVYRSRVSIQYRGLSYSSKRDWSGMRLGITQEKVDDALDYGDRFFTDGYVFQDEGTGNPDSLLPDSTWNWGYHSASQYDAEKQLLTFQKSVSVAQQRVELSDVQQGMERKSQQGAATCGLEFAAEWALGEGAFGELGFSAGGQWIPHWEEQNQFCSFSQNYLIINSLNSAIDTYSYITYGAQMPPPGHTGSSSGPFADPPASSSALIANRPSSVERNFTGVEQGLAETSLNYRNQVRYELDGQQQEFFFGPVFRCRILRCVHGSISARMNLLYASLDIKREEKLWQSSGTGTQELRKSWRDRDEGQRLLLGGSLSAALEWEFAKGLFAGLNASGSWYPEELKFRVGPGRISMRAGAFNSVFFVGYRF